MKMIKILAENSIQWRVNFLASVLYSLLFTAVFHETVKYFFVETVIIALLFSWLDYKRRGEKKLPEKVVLNRMVVSLFLSLCFSMCAIVLINGIADSLIKEKVDFFLFLASVMYVYFYYCLDAIGIVVKWKK
jgi:hypothetical protein